MAVIKTMVQYTLLSGFTFCRSLKLICLLIFLSAAPSVLAQPADQQDSLFRVVRSEVAKKHYDEAILICKRLAETYPENTDYSIFLGKIYSWKGDYPAAISLLSGIVSKHPESYEALEGLVNVYTWADFDELALQYSDQGIKAFPEQKVFFLNKKAIALNNLGREEEAMQAIDEILAIEPHNKDALYLQTRIARKKKNMISLAYQNTSFSSPGMAPWHLGYLEYKHNFAKAPTVFRVNYGNVYSRSGLLYEADVYPKINPKSYLYLNAGFSSGDNVFPQMRAGAEYYRNFRKVFDASLGARYLKFENQDVTMLTGHIAYSHKHWSYAYRPFLAFINSKSYLSNGISIKRMNEVNEQFVQFDVQYGIVPYTFFFSNEINRTGTFRLGIQYQWRIARHFFIRPFLLYEYEEYVPDQYRNRFNVQLTLSRRF